MADEGSVISVEIGFAVFTFTLWLEGLPMRAFAKKYAKTTLTDAMRTIIAISFLFMVLPPYRVVQVIARADSSSLLLRSLSLLQPGLQSKDS